MLKQEYTIQNVYITEFKTSHVEGEVLTTS